MNKYNYQQGFNILRYSQWNVFPEISTPYLLKEDFYLKPIFQAGVPHNRLPREALPMRGTVMI